MSSPETGGSPDTSFDRTRDLVEGAREELAEERASRLTEPAEPEVAEKPSLAERTFVHQGTEYITESIDIDVARAKTEGKRLTKEQLVEAAVDRTLAMRLRQSREDIEAYNKQIEARTSDKEASAEKHPWATKMIRFVDKYRHDKKWRYGILAASTAGAVGLAATGLWMPALAVKAASGALRGTATYLGAREGMDKFAAHRAAKRNDKESTTPDPDREVPDMSGSHLTLEARERVAKDPMAASRIVARLESPTTIAQMSPKEIEVANAWKEELRKAEREQLIDKFKAALVTPEGKAVQKKTEVAEHLKPLIFGTLTKSLETRREATQRELETLQDKKRLKRNDSYRRAAALTLGVLVGASGVAGWLTHGAEESRHLRHAVSAGRHAASAAKEALFGNFNPSPNLDSSLRHAEKGARKVVKHAHHVGNFEFTSHSGDSYWTAGSEAMHHALHEVPGLHDLGSGAEGNARRLIANDYIKDWLLREHHGNSLVNVGARIRVPRSVILHSLTFAHNYKL